MTRFALLLGAAIILAAQTVIGPAKSAQVVHFKSAAAPTTAKINNDRRLDQISIWGHLGLPEGDGPFPAIILLHGCAGINASHFRWAAILNNLGYATLAPDSYSPRSIANRCKLDAGPEVHLPRALDALGALTYLRLRDDIDTERIAIMGWSHGATMALETVSRGGLATQVSPAFKSAIAFYPYCVPDRSFDLPLLILIGEAERTGRRCPDAATWPRRTKLQANSS